MPDSGERADPPEASCSSVPARFSWRPSVLVEAITHGRGDDQDMREEATLTVHSSPDDCPQGALKAKAPEVCRVEVPGPPSPQPLKRPRVRPGRFRPIAPLEIPEDAGRGRRTKWGRCQRCIGYMRVVYPSRDGGEAFLGCSMYRVSQPDSCRFTRSIPQDQLHELNDIVVTRRRVFV